MANVDVLLSASFPDDIRADEFTSRSPQDIGLAASAVINAVLRSETGHLVFGGHPTISPLVLNSAVHLGRKGKATIFQGRFYESLIRDEVEKLVDQGYAERKWVETDKHDARLNTAAMREEMVARPLKAAFFVGGMTGIQNEFDAFRHAWPDRPAFLFTAPGGRAADITATLSADSARYSSQRVRPLGNDVYALDGRGYDYLVSRAFLRIDGLD